MVHLANPTETITRRCMEDNLILGLLLSKLIIHTEYRNRKFLSLPSITTEEDINCVQNENLKTER